MASTSTDRSLNGSNVAFKAPVRVATTSNVTLSGLQTIDGVALAENDRVLVRSQTSGIANGIYVAHSGAWLRSADWDGTSDAVTGTFVFVTAGSTLSKKLYYLSTTGTIIVGTTSIAFTAGTTLS